MSLTFFNRERARKNVENASKKPATTATIKVDEVKTHEEKAPETKEASSKKTDAEKLKAYKE